MANSEHLKILKQGVEVWNKWRWRDENSFINPDLSNINLNGANLRGADLNNTNLTRTKLRAANLRRARLLFAALNKADLTEADLGAANLTGADLSVADLHWVNLNGANLTGADLGRARIFESDLIGADLSRANLSRAEFKRVALYEVNFSQALFEFTTIGDIDLSKATGLETTEHNGPSTLGIDTIFRSGGKIPHKFLEDAGVPDIFINYIESLTGQAIQFFSCFISHSTKDKEFIDRIYADLRKEGVRCWFAPEDMNIGDEIRTAIDKAIRSRDKVLLVLSENSINSEWVKDEVEAAYEEEIQRNKSVLFPIRTDQSVMVTGRRSD